MPFKTYSMSFNVEHSYIAERRAIHPNYEGVKTCRYAYYTYEYTAVPGYGGGSFYSGRSAKNLSDLVRCTSAVEVVILWQ